MAEKRKLLNEMDKCFKKVDEGFEYFDEIMSKMSEANSDNQREKFQDDLKKEIKKLQRLRDQIKGWQNSTEIKDKEKLSHYRKLIEQRMETFKDIERENKTKPHSKQGLSAEDKLDPKEKEKSDAIEWLNNQIRRIQDEIDRTESKVESMLSALDSCCGGGRKGRGKKDEAKKNEKEKIEELKKHLERVKFHLTNLEVVMRLITNEKLEIKEVLTKLKEPVEMYVEALDPDVADGEAEILDPGDIYEEMKLSSYIPQLGGFSIGSIDEDGKSLTGENGGSPPPNSNKEQPHDDHVASEPKPFAHSVPAKASMTAAPAKLMRLGSRISAESCSVSSPPPHTPPPPPSIPYNTVAAGGVSASSAATTSVTPNPNPNSIVVSQPIASAPVPVPSSTIVEEINVISQPQQQTAPPPPPPPPPPPLSLPPQQQQQQQQQASPQFNPPAESNVDQHAAPLPTMQPEASLYDSQPPISSSTPIPSAMAEEINVTSHQQQQQPSSQLNSTTAEPNVDAINQDLLRQVLQRPDDCNMLPQTTTIQPRLGASPLGPVLMTSELEMQRNMLEAAMVRVPVQMDSEKPRTYLPKMPCQTPHYYPQVPPINADSLEYYLRLSPETLFFTFYYMEGSRAQLLAAKALKKLSWRFHTKLMMWFQRHEEPKQITDDFEQGTYVYFDFEKWVQRKREQFTFEYKYLEDKEFD